MGSYKRGFVGKKEHQSNQVFGTDMARTIDANEFKHPMKIIDEEEIL